MDIYSVLGPSLFQGGSAADYAVEVLKNGGFGTRHLPSGKSVPHVLSRVSPEALTQGLPVPGSPAPLVQFASAGMQGAQVGLAVANLGVGLLNLGVSAWTAWKVHKMDKKLGALVDTVNGVDRKVEYIGALLEGSVLHLDGLIRQNALMLGFIIENQAHLGEALIALHVAVHEGFRGIHEAFASAEARRRSDELDQQMRELFWYYELCSREMQAGRAPPPADLRRIVDVAGKLITWLDTRLNALPAGTPERLPLMVARAFALRLEIDARAMLDDAPSARDEEMSRFLGRIQAEIHAISDGASVYDLATGRRTLMEQYVYLHRAMRAPATMVSFDDGQALPFYPEPSLSWDDGLGRVRELLSRDEATTANHRLSLEGLEEHRAWEALTGMPPGASDDAVEVEDLAAALGLPTARVMGAQGLRDLLLEAPKARRDTLRRISKEVG